MTFKQQQFIHKIEELYPDQAEQVVQAMRGQPQQSFWINTNKFDATEVLAQLTQSGFEVKPAPVAHMYIPVSQPEQTSLSRTQIFEDHKIYIQQLSSALPVTVLDPKPGEKILDLSAAPGSKTSLMATITGNKAMITAVDASKPRFFKLKEALQRYSIENVDCILADGRTLLQKHPEFQNYFDKVLVDAPCANEAGLNFSDPTSFQFWNKGKGKSLSNLQKSLLASGFDMLRPGGTLVYSTCTFSVEENEMVVDWLLSKYSNAELLEIKFAENIPFQNGKTEYRRKQFSESLIKTKRIIPNEMFEGFFVAKIIKKLG